MPPQRSPHTLLEARREFVRHWSPRVLMAWLLFAVVVRLVVGDWAWTNLLVVVAVILVQPFLEWVLHVTVLHDKPHQVGGFLIDTVVAKDHRAHHADPRDVELVFIPRRWVCYAIASTIVIAALIPGWSNKGSALVAMSAIALTYEWTHFLIHTDYKPQSWYYRKIYAAHRLHHYRNERYWFGVTNNVADMVFGTYPDKDSVPVSKTAKDLLASTERVGSRSTDN